MPFLYFTSYVVPGSEDPLCDVDFPVVSSAVEDPRSPDPGRSIGPVGMEVGDPVLGAIQTDLVRPVFVVPRPVVLASCVQRKKKNMLKQLLTV